MSIRGLVIALFVLAAIGLGWQQREPLQAWLGRSAAQLQALAEPAAESRPVAGAGARPGGLRKCVKGQQVSYTNVECPPGHSEQAVAAAPVTVLPATPVAKPAAASSGPSSLHKALDLTRDDTLKEKAIERAVNGATR